MMTNKNVFRQLHDQLSQREEELGKSLKSSCEHQAVAAELQDWLASAGERLSGDDVSRDDVVALCVESNASGEQLARLERLEEDLLPDESRVQLRHDIAQQQGHIKALIQRSTQNVSLKMSMSMK